MKKIQKVTKAITHGGKFHTDDVLSTVLIKMLNPNIIVERVNEYVGDDSDENVIVYDIGFGEFDHHQQTDEVNEYGNKYSAFGKLWTVYGKELLEQKGFKKIEDAYSKFYRCYVNKVDRGDNESYRNVKHFIDNTLIIEFNPKWYEASSNPNAYNEQFDKAVEFSTLLMENWLRKLYTLIEVNSQEEEIWEKALDNMEDGIAVLDENIDWRIQYNRSRNENVKIVISASPRGGYRVTSINEDEIKIQDSEHLSFVHVNRFMGVADTKEKAVLAAKETIKNNK